MIHSTAVIHPRAQVDPSVMVGPYSVIDADVVVGPGCWLGSHVYLTGKTVIGSGNRFFSGAVVGEAPQDLKYKGDPSGLRIGNNNTFREHCTVHRANFTGEETVIGDNNLLMAGCHVAHNCVLGNHIILVNGCLIAGHVEIGDRAVISGNCLVHQFVRIGTLAMMQGGSAISKDLPPFSVARGDNHICGLNTIGLRRAGFTSEQRLELRRLYHALFRSGRALRAAVAAVDRETLSPPARVLLDFVATATKRGICADVSAGERAEDGEE
ncbi:MAG TPA: acyl-ACP--UDP-N-acetylglucosamine O-acyltransferase [Methylomirabilota bacterium]|nr:acyl-ACP--UDP-N-acetylglucosamine O-acyltransferase [Methylomirabilota bacterium]